MRCFAGQTNMPTVRCSKTDLIRPEIQALSAYHVPDSKGMIKLDAMENPYTWPPELVAAWLERLRTTQLNRYPHPTAPALKEQLRTAMSIPRDYELILGNGSDELIQLIMLAIATPDRVVVAPEPSFAMYRMSASFTGMRYVSVPLQTPDFSLDLDAMLTAIAEQRPALIFLAYPNNPTGNLFASESVHEIIAAAPGLVVIDEAYFAFADHSFLAALSDYDNLLLLRTVSKMGLAGLRLGLLIGPSHWLNELDKVRLPYNINVLTQISAVFALQHQSILDEQIQRIRHDRAALYAALADLPSCQAFPSAANFILVRTPRHQGDRLAEALRKQGILVKNLNHSSELLHDCLRITVGTPAENKALIAALKTALQN